MGITSTEGTGGPWLPFFLQTADALFPTGSYAHSLGFEEIVRLGIVRDEATLKTFLLEHILPAQRAQELPYLRFAHNAATAGDISKLCEIDMEISAWKLAAETREASAQLGTRRLTALRAIANTSLLQSFSEAVRTGAARGHHLVVCALQASMEGVPIRFALGAAAYQALAAICTAALKLIRIGQNGVQRALRSACLEIEPTIELSFSVHRHGAGWFNPLLEIASMRHARAEERLFIS